MTIANNDETLQRLRETRDALVRVMTWIDNWSPDFTEDDEWCEDDVKIRNTINLVNDHINRQQPVGKE